jgi:FMN phosphatase YigB (HAD superfamily)
MTKFNYKKNIKVIGFDLDQTLYTKSPKIDEAIQKYIYQKIVDHKNIKLTVARKLFRELYKEGQGLSGSKSLEALKIPRAKEIIQEALELADIAKYLKPNKKTSDLILALKKRYKNIDLITGSNLKITKLKLKSLTLPLDYFSHIITKDDGSKSEKTAYKIWLGLYPKNKLKDFLYIGDRKTSDYEIPKEMGIKTILVNQNKLDANIKCPQLSKFNKLKRFLL